AWISMILVTQAWRRQGLATRLMQRCIDALDTRRLVPALDASPAGREVYRRIGFRDVATSTRLGGDLSAATPPAAVELAALTPADLAAVAAYDKISSGTDRTILLGHLRQRLPAAAFVARRQGAISRFDVAWPGRPSA